MQTMTRADALVAALKTAREQVFQTRLLLDQAKESLALVKRAEEQSARASHGYGTATNDTTRKAYMADWLDASRTYLQAADTLRQREQERDEAILRLEMAEDDWRGYAYAALEKIADGRYTTGNSDAALERLANRIVAAITQGH
jgi:hypothetical protein